MRQEHAIELKEFQLEYLEKIVADYDIPDIGKAVRCLIDYAIEEKGKEKELFQLERCHSCDQYEPRDGKLT